MAILLDPWRIPSFNRRGRHLPGDDQRGDKIVGGVVLGVLPAPKDGERRAVAVYGKRASVIAPALLPVLRIFPQG